MDPLKNLFENNQRWADSKTANDPDFFSRLSKGQNPDLLWIGCSDSRVPANELIGLDPGECFVHRNIANVVVHSDMNCLSVVEYAVKVLKVKHIAVCGHYGCGGVAAALGDRSIGLIDNWIRHIKDVASYHRNELSKVVDPTERINKLCEFNVASQVANLAHTSIVQRAWDRGQELTLHGWIYDIKDGLLKDLSVCRDNNERMTELFQFDFSNP